MLNKNKMARNEQALLEVDRYDNRRTTFGVKRWAPHSGHSGLLCCKKCKIYKNFSKFYSYNKVYKNKNKNNLLYFYYRKNCILCYNKKKKKRIDISNHRQTELALPIATTEPTGV